ncbi:hypothetical protein DFJ63DRAFT_170279 [Scheffersomyces coipomensis]|uniref:uncharacterized protein n=1 Tax=Scheffersomyces coipomensis TaxID=1788519 RepID=UPI00315D14B6
MIDPNDSVTFGNSLSLRVDGAIGAMSLSPNGRDALLAGRRGLFVIDLDDPFTTPRWLHHITSWEVADVQWSPHHFSKPSWCISTSNQKALLWDLSRPSNNAIFSVLHNHARAITDINFHPSDPELLATCSIDTFILSWDMRTPRKPVAQWAEWRAGATQVKWNHENPYEIASSHDNNFYVWDSRKGALPLVKVNKAHNGKINGLDFSNGSSNVITCSNDNTIKFWNLKNDEAIKFSNNFNYFASKDTDSSGLKPTVVIETDFPIARARSLPFGSDKACGIMPLRGGQDSIHIVNYDDEFQQAALTNQTQVISNFGNDEKSNYSFKGHNGPMKDFLWRTKQEKYAGFDSKNKHKDFQLVTWSSVDYDLKLWPHDDELYRRVNYNPSYHNLLGSFKPDDEPESDNNSTRPQSPSVGEIQEYNYKTYLIEPEVSIEDLKRKNNGDLLSSLTSYQIYEKYQKQYNNNNNNNTSDDLYNQLNHLDWISGVRMGRAGHVPHRNANGIVSGKDSDDGVIDGPSNLGEEVSIVGHKFPKVRFERISVSTGELVLSLRGPVPSPNEKEKDKSDDDPNKSSILDNFDSKNSISASGVGEPSEIGESVATNNTNNTNNATTSIPGISVAANNNIVSSNLTANNSTATSNNNITTGNSKSVPSVSDDSNQDQILVFIRLQIKFPKEYPYLEEINYSLNAKKLAKLQKQNLVKFEIEETHELTRDIKDEMILNLNEIAEFYTNKHKRFTLEPCLRYLMGDKMDLNDELMMDTRTDSNEEHGDGEFIQEVGAEGWADDLINQQPGYMNNQMKDESSGEEDNDGFNDLIVHNDELLRSIDSVNKLNKMNDSNGGANAGEIDESNKEPVFDSTPIPKGCGAVWSPTGHLVCFFIPKDNAEEEESASQKKFNIFKFTDGGFSLNTHDHTHHHHHHHHVEPESDESEEVEDDDQEISSDSDQSQNSAAGSDDESIESITSSSSDDSFTNDWDEILETDAPARTRVPGMFVGLGNRYINRHNNTKSGSFNRFASHGGGTISNYKSSIRDGNKKKRSRDKKVKNIVGIFDFRHLLPDKYELACEYRVLGDSPENLARYNSEVALKYGLTEISDVWKILEVILLKYVQMNDIYTEHYPSYLGPNLKDIKTSQTLNQLMNSNIAKKIITKPGPFFWGTHPFGSNWLIKEIFNYFELKLNVQMLTMMSCILYENPTNFLRSPSRQDLALNIPIHTPYQVLPPPPSIIAVKKFNEESLLSGSNNQSSPDESNFPSVSHRNSNNSMVIYNHTHGIKSLDGEFLFNDYSPPDRTNGRKHILPALTPSSYNETSISLDKYKVISPQQSLTKARTLSHLESKRTPKPLNKKASIRHINSTISNKLQKKLNGSLPIVNIEFQNSNEFDMFEDNYTLSLLSSQDELKINGYRQQYADMLFSWQLPINRIKILKFNHPPTAVKNSNSTSEHACQFGIRFKVRQFSTQEFIQSVTTIPTSRSNAWNTSKRNMIKYCNLCNLIVAKNLIVCTNCEHILHTECAAQWWQDGEEDCPSGCGCNCLQHV